MNQVSHSAVQSSVNRLALSATLHCLTGCSIGEVLGMMIGTALRGLIGSGVNLGAFIVQASIPM